MSEQGPSEEIADGGGGCGVPVVRSSLSCFFVPFERLICYRDRRKLTFYFVADKRIDFRELVRELFRCVFFSFVLGLPLADGLVRLYKTRIWMASLQGGGGFEQ